LPEPIHPHDPRCHAGLEAARRQDRPAVTHPRLRRIQLRCQQPRYCGDRLFEMSPISVEERQLDGAASGVALAIAVVARHRRQTQALRKPDGSREARAVFELFAESAVLEQGQHRVDALVSDVLARHALAKALGAVIEDAADQDVIGFGARVRGVLDRLAQGDADVAGGQFLHSHRNIRLSDHLTTAASPNTSPKDSPTKNSRPRSVCGGSVAGWGSSKVAWAVRSRSSSPSRRSIEARASSASSGCVTASRFRADEPASDNRTAPRSWSKFASRKVKECFVAGSGRQAAAKRYSQRRWSVRT